jgi:hypothetical protein
VYLTILCISIVFLALYGLRAIKLITTMSVGYFLTEKNKSALLKTPHSFVILAKTILGVFLLLAGFAMLFLPSQGVITMLVGLSLLNFPGKRRLELAIVKNKKVAKALSCIRIKSNKEPF